VERGAINPESKARNFLAPAFGETPKATRYTLAVVAALVAIAVRWAASPLVGTQMVFTAVFPALFFSAWYLGLGPSIVTGVTGFFGSWYLFISPVQPFSWDDPKPALLRTGGFLLLSTIIILVGERDRRSRTRVRELIAETVKANAQFRAVFEQSPIFAGLMSLDGTLIDANQLSLEASGYSADQVLGRVFWETPWWRESKDAQRKIRTAAQLAAQGKPYVEELPYVVADGTPRKVDFGLHPIRDENGEISFLYATGTDITDRKRAEENFRKLAGQLESEVTTRTRELESRNSDVLRQTELLRVLSSRLMEVQDAERRRIARELHDSAGQLLSVLSINLSNLAQQSRTKAPELAETSDECHRIVQQMSQEIRTMSYLLHPPLLEEIGLSAALDWYVKGLTERSELDVRLSVPEKFRRLPRELELAVFRVVQECLTNIYRHSGSKTASIEVSIQKDNLLLVIADQGTGIPREKLSQIQSYGSGVGIQGIRERLRAFQGEMQIESSDSGTTITVTFKVPAEAEQLKKMQAI
jgi:PAS domain S-box-containing protein